MSDKILLIDGHSILNRAFYGLPDLTNAQGLHTNAVYGFLTTMFKILDEEQPAYLAVAFDVHAPTFRHELYEDYKGTRKPMAEELRQQVPVMKDVLHDMGICTVEKEGLEADDIMGTLSRRCEGQGMDVCILTGDRDILQLATEHTQIRIPKTKQGRTEVEDYYSEDVKEKYGVTPEEFIDVKALMGDTADNIPGLPGVGEKTALSIISKYHSIENAHEHAKEVKPPRASKALIEQWDLAVLSKNLATIRVHADFDFDLEEARLGNIYTEKAYATFRQLQFKNLLSRFDVVSPANAVEDSFRLIEGRKEAEDFLEKAAGAECVGISLYKDPDKVLPLFAGEAGIDGAAVTYGSGAAQAEGSETACLLCGDAISPDWLLGKLSDLTGTAGKISMFAIKAALPYIHMQRQEACFDVSVAAYLLNPLKNEYRFEDVAQEHLGLIIEEKADKRTLACYAAYTAYAAPKVLLEKLEETGMKDLFMNMEMPLIFTLYGMERAGMKVDAEALKEYGEKLWERIQELEKEIYADAGETFNINSPKQLGVVLFEHLKIPGGRKTKSGYSTAADVLEKLAPDYPLVAKILEYRQYAKLKSTYADGLSAYIQEDGRIHTKFNQTVTATGRLSSTEPNLQNIPIRMELGRMIRKVFIPEDGYIFLDADYSQIELRVLAHCSGDPQLTSAYREKKDIHRITASQVFHVPYDEVTPIQRRNAKAVNFGIVYGISSYGLSQDLNISRKEAQEYIERYFETFPKVKELLDTTVSAAKEEGYVTTMFGRRRPVPELSSSNYSERSFGERVAMNAPIQGSAADIIKIAMIGVDRRLKEQGLKSRLVLQIHDELLIEAYLPELDTVKEILEEEMEHAAALQVPLVVDMHTGTNWYDAK